MRRGGHSTENIAYKVEIIKKLGKGVVLILDTTPSSLFKVYSYPNKLCYHLKKKLKGPAQWFNLVILATQKTKIGRMQLEAS
jgi:hypothetical protein